MDPAATVSNFLKWCAAFCIIFFLLWRGDIEFLSLEDIFVKPFGSLADSNDDIVAANNADDIVTPNTTHNPPHNFSHYEHSHHTQTNIISHNISANETNSSGIQFYHGLWDFETHSIHIPNKQPGDKITSLEILQNVLREDDTHNGLPTRSCFIADTERTEDIVRAGVVDLPRPILNVGMPKCGSTTLGAFFACAGLKQHHGQDGFCIAQAVKEGKPPISGCKATRGKDALTQLDVNFPNNKKCGLPEGCCWFPQVSFLDEIHKEFPNATFVMNFRPVDDWINSGRHFGGMAGRWSDCVIPGKMKAGEKMTQEEYRNWLCGHVKHVREFVKQYSSHKLIELDLYDTERSARVMSSLFHANKTCWGHDNSNENIHN